jgi:hypothetical protein
VVESAGVSMPLLKNVGKSQPSQDFDLDTYGAEMVQAVVKARPIPFLLGQRDQAADLRPDGSDQLTLCPTPHRHIIVLRPPPLPLQLLCAGLLC